MFFKSNLDALLIEGLFTNHAAIVFKLEESVFGRLTEEKTSCGSLEIGRAHV